MHLRHLSPSAAALALGASLSFGQSLATPGPSLPPPPASAVPVDTMLEVYGWFLGEQMQVFAFGLSGKEIEALNRGIALAAKGEQPAADLEMIGPSLQAFLEARPAEVQERRAAQSREEERELFAKLDANSAVKKTASGLRYEIVAPGSDKKPGLGDSVIAHYTGTFVDGTVFDSSRERGEPAQFELDGVIEGWQEGLQLIGTGGRIKLYIPGVLGYGDTGNRNIPPAKPLLFDVELIDTMPAQPTLAPSQPSLAPGFGP